MKHLASVILMTFLFFSGEARASLVTFDFTAFHSKAVPGVDVPALSTYAGSFTWDTAVPSAAIHPGFEVQYSGALKTVTLGPDIIDVSGWSVNTADVEINTLQGTTEYLVTVEQGTAEISIAIVLPVLASSFDLPSAIPDDLPGSFFGIGLFNDNVFDLGDPISTLTAVAVPEPASTALFAGGLLYLAGSVRRRKGLRLKGAAHAGIEAEPQARVESKS